tara:strand:+ start:1243 stop:1641 length:399 start_codon:yes stop_codon:yes gene_type:complete
MGLMKKLLFLTFLFSLLSPVYSDISEDKENSKYSFYEKCMESENSSVSKCLKEANENLDSLIQKRISSKGDCEKEGFESLACSVKRSQKSFKTYYQTECTWNMYGAMYSYCEMMLKKDRLKWLDKTLGSSTQ